MNWLQYQLTLLSEAELEVKRFFLLPGEKVSYFSCLIEDHAEATVAIAIMAVVTAITQVARSFIIDSPFYHRMIRKATARRKWRSKSARIYNSWGDTPMRRMHFQVEDDKCMLDRVQLTM